MHIELLLFYPFLCSNYKKNIFFIRYCFFKKNSQNIQIFFEIICYSNSRKKTNHYLVVCIKFSRKINLLRVNIVK